MFETPVLFLIFNRPDLTKQVFSVIQQAKPKYLFVAADGPRCDRPEDHKLCNETRESVMEMIDWDCEVKSLFRKENLGCKLAVSGAIDWFFEHVEEGIILEDDCVPHISFFRYCEELLTKYRYDLNVNFISGTCLPNVATHIDESYFFSKFSIIWGWATWRRVWRKYDVSMVQWAMLRETDWIENVFYGNKYFSKGFREIFDSIRDGYNTWDFQLFFLNMKESSFNIHPTKNLISNIGFDNRGTHTFNKTIYTEMQTLDIGEIRHPEVKVYNFKADELIFEHLYKYDPRAKTILRVLIQKINFRAKRVMKWLKS